MRTARAPRIVALLRRSTRVGIRYDGSSRSAAIRQAVLEAARRRERAAEMRRAVLRMDLGQPDGVNVAEELARDRAGEH